MPYTDETLALTDDLRIYLRAETDESTRSLVRAWSLAWTEISREFQAAAFELIAMVEAGQWPTPWQVARSQRAKDALAAAQSTLTRLADASGVEVIDRTGRVIAETPGWERRIVGSMLPAEVSLAGTFDRFDADALDAIVKRSTQRITSLMGKIPDEAYRALRAALVRGVALGENPREVAARLVRQAEHAWTSGLSRALTIARTEMLDAHRAASAAHHAANADVLKGWRWQCSLSERTCPACLAMHGTVYPLSEPGPIGHQNCRCTRSPVTRTWRDLGFDLPEPPDLFPDARQWFDSLGQSAQLSIMGPQRLAALKAGALSWGQLAVRRSTPGWRDSFVTRPLSARQLKAAA